MGWVREWEVEFISLGLREKEQKEDWLPESDILQ